MAITTEMLNRLVSITQFNRGQASRIFDRLQTERELIVLKNNQPSAIILSPEEYTRLSEIAENYTLMLEADERLARNGDKPAVPFDSVLKSFGISEKEIDDAEDIKIE